MLRRLLSIILLPVAMLLTGISPPPTVPARVTVTEDEPICSSFQTFDAISGAVARLGAARGVPTPLNAALAALVRACSATAAACVQRV